MLYIYNSTKLLTSVMKLKKIIKKKAISFKNVNSLIPKKINLYKFKVNPLNVIEDTKNKIGNFILISKK